MSHQPERHLHSTNPVFKEPNNLDVINDAIVLPSERELISSSADIRVCKYAICISKDNIPGLLPEDKDYKVRHFGDIPNLMDSDDLSQPMTFESFVGLILSQSDLNVTQQSVNVWATANLNTPAVRIGSNRQFADLFINYNDLFHRDPLHHSILYFFVDFNGPSGIVPSGSTRQHTSPPFLGDQVVDEYTAAGGISPKHIPATPTGYEPTDYIISRRHATQPHDQVLEPSPVQPKRAKTLETGKRAINKLMVAVKSVPETVKELVSPREAPQQNTVLTQLASRIDQEDYLTGLLPKTNGSPQRQAVIDAYQAEQFERFARFFPHIDPKQRENRRTIRFKHTALAVTPHQFTRAMEILFQDDTTGGLTGGILASEMGSGKSFVILGAVTIRAILHENERRVRREWEEVEARERTLKKGVRPVKLNHLPHNARRGVGLKCPTQSDRPADCVCFCVPDGPTRTQISRLKRGAALIHVPSASMPGWIETLEEANFSRMAYNVQVLYSGPPLSSRLQPGPEFLKGKNSSVNNWSMGAVLPEGRAGGMISRTQDLTWFAQPAPLSNRLAMAMETYIVVTSHNSTQLRDLYSWDIKDLSPAPQNCQFPPGGLYAHPFGLTFIDEAHKVLQKDSMPLQMAALSRQILPTPSATTVGDVWLVSGTPFGGQLKDLIAAISYLAPDRADDARALLEAYDAIEPAMTNTPRTIFEALFNRVFGGQLTIRDAWDTTFMGSRITGIQKVQPQYISRETPQSNLHTVRMVMTTKVTAGPRDAYFDTLQKLKPNTQLLYLLSMFPSAAKVLLDSPDTPFADWDIRTMIRKEKNTTGESLTSNKTFRSLAEKLARSPRSPKLQYILDELDRMERDRTPRPQVSRAGSSAHVQDDPALKKMVIITPTVFTAVMLYIILARNHPRTKPLLYHGDLKQSQRSDVLRRFNSLRKRDGPARVFIAPASVGSEALNLQIANRLILTSPLLDPNQESQALARVNRVGQTLDVQQKVLLLEDSPVDRIVIAHRANAKFLNDPFNVAEAVRVVTSDSDSASTLAP
ncbi:hypothetical protein INS49_015351 [Diaporthe citri]|uniref:uncharacterized protein n=1 Tax=Diaporthe citri TaxID=83186 RepID=UPI001C7FD0D5|nr:uncharacterized protein INS49_015351 [Diaporthe citri]KAG6355966.1 hypothetical protein INS49_015351 [Diaporthe citri]